MPRDPGRGKTPKSPSRRKYKTVQVEENIKRRVTFDKRFKWRLSNRFSASYRTFPEHSSVITFPDRIICFTKCFFPNFRPHARPYSHSFVLIRTHSHSFAFLALRSKNSLSQPGLQLIRENVTSTTTTHLFLHDQLHNVLKSHRNNPETFVSFETRNSSSVLSAALTVNVPAEIRDFTATPVYAALFDCLQYL